jgi:LPS-assembly lipoprotein
MNRRLALSALCALPVLSSLTACGFRLRGMADFPFRTLYVGLPANSAMGAELRRAVRGGSSTQIIEDQKAADAILEVLKDAREKTIVAVTPAGVVREYKLTQRFEFRLRDQQGRELIAPSEIVLMRDLTYNEVNALAKDYEEAQLYREMQKDIVQQLIRRMSAAKAV